MIIDVHTHIPTHRDAVPAEENLEGSHLIGADIKLTGSVDEFLGAMAPVDKAIVFGIAPKSGLIEPPIMDWRPGWSEGMNQNDVAVEVAKRAPDRIIPFMSLHPMQTDIDDEYDRSVGDLGCKGIKLSLSYQVADPLSKESYHLFSRLEKDGLPVMFHQGASVSDYARLMYAYPLVMDEVALAFPKLKMILAHMAHPWHADCITVIRKHPNMWADISGQPFRPWVFWNGMRLFHEFSVTDKILLGSDWPLKTPQETIDGMRAVCKFARDYNLPPIPEEEIEGIINRDSLALLGLE